MKEVRVASEDVAETRIESWSPEHERRRLVRPGAGQSRPVDHRVIVFTDGEEEFSISCHVLEQIGLKCLNCNSVLELCSQIQVGAGVVLISEEAISSAAMTCLDGCIREQPPWSDLPLIVFAKNGDTTDTVVESLGLLGNVTILERPVRITTLISAVRSGLRARRRQYQVRDLLTWLEESSRRKDEFLAMLGHELRNPMAAIRNALEMMGRTEDLDDRTFQQKRIISRQVQTLTRLVDDLLDVSRVTLGKVTLHCQKVNFDEIVRHTLDSYRPALAEQGLQISEDLTTQACIVDGDPVRLEQIVSNLLSNAIKYTPSGGSVRVSLQAEDGMALLRVADTGVGISPEMLPRVFDLFAQADVSIARTSGGLGLGLTLVRELVHMHGGAVAVESQGRGKGSTFEVRVPCQTTGPGPAASSLLAPSRENAPRSARSTRHILLIDDNTDVRETLRDILELEGYLVDCAGNGLDGVQKALTNRPEMVLIDIGLPAIDGYEVARRIRASGSEYRPALVAITGYGQPEDYRLAMEAGFDTHLVKPIDPGLLIELLADAPVDLAKNE